MDLSRFDFFNPDMMRDPYPYFAQMREQAPIHYDAKLQAHVLSRYEDVSYVLKNHALFSSTQVRVGGKLQEERAASKELSSVSSLVSTDPPMHTNMRGMVSRSFTPKQINALAPRVRELSHQLVAEMTSRPEFDFMDGLASPLPVTIIAEMLGIDPSRRRDFKRWSDTLIQATNTSMRTGKQPEEVVRSAEEMLSYMKQVAEERRREPRGDLISLLVRETDGVAALSPQEVNSFTVLLLIAGNETTTNLLGNALAALIRNPEAYARLREDPSPAACAAVCEETLRYDLFGKTGVPKFAKEALEFNGVPLRKGQMVIPHLPAALRDGEVFPEPDRFDIRRDVSQTLAFGGGQHFCLGAAVARMELDTVVGTLVRRFATLRLAGEPEFEPHPIMRAMRRLDVTVR